MRKAFLRYTKNIIYRNGWGAIAMALHRNNDEFETYVENNFMMEEEGENIKHRVRVRKMLEGYLERKRQREEQDELDSEVDWED